MSLYLKQIEQLISLQKVDDEIHEIKKELETAPLELEALRARYTESVEQFKRHEEKMTHLHEQEKRLGLELQDDNARLKKSKSKLMSSGNAKEYHAMMREMDSLERVNRNREEEQSALREEVIRQTTLLSEAEAACKNLGDELAAFETGIQDKLAANQAALDKLMLRRNDTAKEVPQPVFQRYEFIRERLEHPVIVPVTAGICSGCHIAIPPQNFIELQKAAQILSCPNCQRLMFWSEHFTPPVEEGGVAAD